MATVTARQDLLAMIEMTEDAIAWCQSEGVEHEKQSEVLAKYRTQLAALGDSDGNVYTVPTVEGEKARLTDRPAAGARAANQFGEFKVHFASAKQTGFIRSLMERKDLSPLADSVTIDVARLREQVAKGEVNKKAASAIIDRLLSLPDAAPAVNAATSPAKIARPASDKQVGLIGRLAAERHYADAGMTSASQPALGTIAAVLAGTPVKSRDASAAIDYLFGCAKRREPVVTVALEAGMYRTGDTLVRVYYGRQSGQMLAKKVVKTGVTYTDAEGVERDEYTFEYMGKADRFITADQRLSLEEAKVWGRMTASCCVCTAHLDDPNSVQAGIGPICAQKF